MRAIQLIAAQPHQFYRLLGEATSVGTPKPQALPAFMQPTPMPRMAYCNGGTRHAFSVEIPVINEARTKAGKRILYVGVTLR